MNPETKGREAPLINSESQSGAEPTARTNRRPLLAVFTFIVLGLFVISGKAQTAWEQVTQLLSLQGKPEPASASVFSEHEIEGLDKQTPQAQAELLMERSINHYRGANDEIAARVDQWRGKIKLEGRLDNLFMTALNSDDLRVRAAAIELDLAARNREKNLATVASLEPDASFGEQGPRANALWDLGLLGNRGVEPQRVAQILLNSIHDSNVNVRYWAVEGLAYLGTDETVEPLLQVMHDDPSPMIRERAACGLAQSGMLNERQRRSAVPKLLDYSEDPSIDAETRKWTFQALRDITGQSLPHDTSAWRNWYNSDGAEWHPVTRDGE